MTSWRVNQDGPAPQVVFEILSAKTWKADLNEKPALYALMGVQEYFAYDPNTLRLDRDASSRLSGWQLDPLTRQMQPMALLANGSLWSIHLDSFLIPGGKRLYLADRQGHRRLTQAQAEKGRADAEARRAAALAEKLRSLGIDPDQL